MKNIPKKSSQWGAPIVWDEVSSSITCEFCGSKTYIRNNFINVGKITDKLNTALAPAGKLINDNTKILLRKQNLFPEKQVDQIGKKINQIISIGYFKVLIIAVPITLI